MFDGKEAMDLLLAHGTKTEQASTERALENVRRLVQRNRQHSGIERSSAQPRPVRSVGIIGAGMMGSALAAIHVKRNLPVVITDTDPRVLEGAEDRIVEELSHEMRGGEIPGDEAPAAQPRQLVKRLVHPTTTEAVFSQCDLVIESILETLPAKRKLYARFEPHLNDRAILASNTSTIPIGQLVEGLANPDRFCGLHFFHPVRRRPLLEIVCGGQTGDVAIATAVAHAKAIDKMPIVVDDGPGFLVNRLLIPYLAEALEYINAWRQSTPDNPTGICGPIGPTAQLPLVARLVNELDLNVKDAHFWGMDEWLEDGEPVPTDHPLSFARGDKELCFDRIRPELCMPEAHLHFPTGDLEGYSKTYDEVRCVVMQGGQGEVKHWAFNDPPKRQGQYTDAPPPPKEYCKLKTRVTDLHPMTIIQNARTS
ncbi:hypothetical protein LCGC14_2315310, partial [marine sediment metagenome]